MSIPLFRTLARLLANLAAPAGTAPPLCPAPTLATPADGAACPASTPPIGPLATTSLQFGRVAVVAPSDLISYSQYICSYKAGVEIQGKLNSGVGVLPICSCMYKTWIRHFSVFRFTFLFRINLDRTLLYSDSVNL